MLTAVSSVFSVSFCNMIGHMHFMSLVQFRFFILFFSPPISGHICLYGRFTFIITSGLVSGSNCNVSTLVLQNITNAHIDAFCVFKSSPTNNNNKKKHIFVRRLIVLKPAKRMHLQLTYVSHFALEDRERFISNTWSGWEGENRQTASFCCFCCYC